MPRNNPKKKEKEKEERVEACSLDISAVNISPVWLYYYQTAIMSSQNRFSKDPEQKNN